MRKGGCRDGFSDKAHYNVHYQPNRSSWVSAVFRNIYSGCVWNHLIWHVYKYDCNILRAWRGRVRVRKKGIRVDSAANKIESRKSKVEK